MLKINICVRKLILFVFSCQIFFFCKSDKTSPVINDACVTVYYIHINIKLQYQEDVSITDNHTMIIYNSVPRKLHRVLYTQDTRVVGVLQKSLHKKNKQKPIVK